MYPDFSRIHKIFQIPKVPYKDLQLNLYNSLDQLDEVELSEMFSHRNDGSIIIWTPISSRNDDTSLGLAFTNLCM